MKPVLPITPHLHRIEAALASEGALVLQAAPGAGKTTLVPPALLRAPFLAGSGMLVLEPRRIAAVAAAARIAELLGERLGATAGYAVRLQRCAGPQTRIEVVTEGLFVRRLLADSGLEGIALVVLDEFHERSVAADLALAMLLEARRMRPDLRLLLMSATLDAERVAAFVGCPSLAVPGSAHPVSTRHEPCGAGFDAASIARSAQEALAETGGDVLVFLAGAREMRQVQAELERADLRAGIARLHGMMSLEQQREVIAPREGRPPRIVLATNVAETSLTVPGVRAVVDSGFVRLSRFHPRSGMNRLVTERVSAASADQRRGRAGRLGPGLCVRCWARGERLAAETPPEILRAEISGAVLAAALWGAREPGDLPFLDPPPPALWQAAAELLRSLGAVDARLRPTERGRAIAATGLEPRLGAVVEQGVRSGAAPLACACAALLSARDDSSLREDADFRLRLQELRRALAADRPPAAYAQAIREYRHLASAAGGGRSLPSGDDCGPLLLAAFPDRLAQRIECGLFRLPSGRVARLRGALAEQALVVAVEADAGEATGTIALAAPVSREEAEEVLAHLVEERDEITWEGFSPRARRLRRVGAVVLADRPVARPDARALAASLASRVREAGLAALPWSRRGLSLLARVQAAGGRVSALPDFGEEALLDGVEEWLVPFARADGGIDAGSLDRALRARLGPRAAAALAREAPETLVLPSGARRPIVYGEGEPYVAVRIQDAFGLAASPLVCGRPLVFRLLSPADRTLQITRDLASFWRTAYPRIRPAMRARYPKHRWPEDPALPDRGGGRPRGASGPKSKPVK